MSALGFSVQEMFQLAPGHSLSHLDDGCACWGGGEWGVGDGGKQEGLNGIMIENQIRASGK